MSSGLNWSSCIMRWKNWLISSIFSSLFHTCPLHYKSSRCILALVSIYLCIISKIFKSCKFLLISCMVWLSLNRNGFICFRYYIWVLQIRLIGCILNFCHFFSIYTLSPCNFLCLNIWINLLLHIDLFKRCIYFCWFLTILNNYCFQTILLLILICFSSSLSEYIIWIIILNNYFSLVTRLFILIFNRMRSLWYLDIIYRRKECFFRIFQFIIRCVNVSNLYRFCNFTWTIWNLLFLLSLINLNLLFLVCWENSKPLTS